VTTAARWVDFVSEGLTPAALHQEVAMKGLNRRCAGLDVRKDEVVACVRLAARGKPSHEVRRFATTTRGLLELADWLDLLESWHVLEERFQLVLANAAHVRNVPGRKSDVNDATWIADSWHMA
jgi:hypothetical protein